MRVYIIRRVLLIIPTLFVATLIVFFVIRIIPGSAIDLLLSEADLIMDSTREAIEHDLGLDVPAYIQYGRWMKGILLHGDFGTSFWTKMPVTQDIISALPVTFELGLLAFIVTLIIAVPIGLYSAIRQDTAGDYLGRSFAILCIAVPHFWIGTLIVVFGSIWGRYSPPIRFIRFTEDPLANLGMLIIPAIVLGMGLAGVTMRMTRNMMLEVLRQDYIRTAWSKGLKERRIVMRHALKNALIPVITILGLYVSFTAGGAVIIEQIFSLPGMGRLIVTGAFQRDYPMITGAMLFTGAFVALANLMVDLTYGVLDPRIRLK